jgi:cytoskeletal protein CcmA (bactofilin family)
MYFQKSPVTGALVSGDVLGEDNSEIILASDPDAGMTSVVSGDLTANDNNEVSGDTIHVKGNVTASNNSRVRLTASMVDGNVTIFDAAEVSIDSQTVVQGDIEGVLLRSEDGYSVYGAYPAE